MIDNSEVKLIVNIALFHIEEPRICLLKDEDSYCSGFPGGVLADSDLTINHAALRLSLERIGLDLDYPETLNSIKIVSEDSPYMAILVAGTYFGRETIKENTVWFPIHRIYPNLIVEPQRELWAMNQAKLKDYITRIQGLHSKGLIQ